MSDNNEKLEEEDSDSHRNWTGVLCVLSVFVETLRKTWILTKRQCVCVCVCAGDRLCNYEMLEGVYISQLSLLAPHPMCVL